MLISRITNLFFPKEDIFRIGIMGTGHMAYGMVRTINRMRGFECVAVASRNLERAASFAKKNEIKYSFGNYEQMLSEISMDMVYIATLNNYHKDNAMLCIEHSIPALVEKPICLSTDEYNDLMTAANRKGIYVAEAMLLRFSKILPHAKYALDNEIIGKPLLMTASLGIYMPELERIHNPQLGGGSTYDLGVYLLALADYLFKDDTIGNPPKIEKNTIYGNNNEDISNITNIWYKFHDTDVQCILADSVDAKYDNNAIIYCENGRIEIEEVYNISKVRIIGHNGIKEYTRDKKKDNGYNLELLESRKKIRSY